MTWQLGAAYFFGGLFLANFTPHFVAGVSGRPFPTPFARPPFRGLSSPAVNILWALFNLLLAYLLLVLVGNLELGRPAQVAIAATGLALGSLLIARSLTRLHQQSAPAAPPPGSGHPSSPARTPPL